MFEQNDNYGYNSAMSVENEISLQRYVAAVMRKVYAKMTFGLLVTAIMAMLVVTSPSLMNIFYGNSIAIWVLIAAEFGLVLFLSFRIDKISTGTAAALFYVYSALTGVTFAPIFIIYTGASIATTFAITAGTFGAMSLFGYVTKQDLTKFGSILFMALIGLIICVVVNMFMGNETLDLIISIAGVFIFVGLTAWDTQKIKRMCAVADDTQKGKVATMGALALYLDFINLFIYLLRLFGRNN